MHDTSCLVRTARECLGAAELLAGRFPVQSMELMARSVETALRACCAAEGIVFEAGDDRALMVRFVPDEVWGEVPRTKVERLLASSEAWARSSRIDGDFMKALDADLETAEKVLQTTENFLGVGRPEMAA